MTNDKKSYLEYEENGKFLITMLGLFLKRTKQWKAGWLELIGEDFHYRSSEWDTKYDEFDGDFFSVYAKTGDGTFEEYCFLFSDFLKWDKDRHDNPK